MPWTSPPTSRRSKPGSKRPSPPGPKIRTNPAPRGPAGGRTVPRSLPLYGTARLDTSGNRLLVGAGFTDTEAADDTGSAHFYTRTGRLLLGERRGHRRRYASRSRGRHQRRFGLRLRARTRCRSTRRGGTARPRGAAKKARLSLKRSLGEGMPWAGVGERRLSGANRTPREQVLRPCCGYGVRAPGGGGAGNRPSPPRRHRFSDSARR